SRLLVPARRSVSQALRQACAPTLGFVARHRHEVMVFLASGAAWALMLARHEPSDWAALCISISGAGLQRIEQLIEAAWRLGFAGEAMASWTVMCLAMVPVLAFPMIRFVAVRSFAKRRGWAIAEFLAGSL